jgi:hypothetical protein
VLKKAPGREESAVDDLDLAQAQKYVPLRGFSGLYFNWYWQRYI